MAGHYELMCTVSGTKTDDEVREISRTISEALTALGCADTTIETLGRVRLQYPMQGDYTGVFLLSKFSCDPAVAQTIQEKLRYSDALRRVVLRRRDPKRVVSPRLVARPPERSTRIHTPPTIAPVRLSTEEIERKVEEAIQEVDTPPAG